MAEQNVLVVEDEENLLEALKYNLEREGYKVTSALNGELGLTLARESNPDLIILDIMLPELDGFEICRILRRGNNVPILMLTAKAEEVDRIVGLDLGADDYVTKPFSMREVMARVRALLRRPRQSTETPLHEGYRQPLRANDLELDVKKHQVSLRGAPLSMKPREFQLLELLMTNRGTAFTRDQILERLWGYDYIGDIRTVDVHVRWLREKIEADPSDPKRIVTIRGVGYRFEG